MCEESLPYVCPHCGQCAHFTVQAQSTFDVTADGTEVIGDVEWHDESMMQCADCAYQAAVGAFAAAYAARSSA